MRRIRRSYDEWSFEAPCEDHFWHNLYGHSFVWNLVLTGWSRKPFLALAYAIVALQGCARNGLLKHPVKTIFHIIGCSLTSHAKIDLSAS
jgi:hypothetical protein